MKAAGDLLGVVLFLVVAAPGFTGCVAPEHCRGCLVALSDAGTYVPPKADGGEGTGGAIVGTGGAQGSGGMVATGGSASGGNVGTGGAATGGAGTGGAATGGAGTGGAATGGAATGGRGTGGAATGGAATGGAGTGGRGTGGAATGGAGTGGATDPDLVLWYKFDETSGRSVSDSSGNARTGTVTVAGAGTAAFQTANNKVPPGALNLTSTSPTAGGYVVVPAGLNALGATTSITISVWVNVRTARSWVRIFDFGNGSTMTSSYAFLTTQQLATTPNAPRFAISLMGTTSEQVINMTAPAALSTGVWHHIAVVLGPGTTYTGTLYIDKVAVGTNPAMTIRPSALGATTQNWIGRSQFTTNDTLFDGFIDDFRIYKRALTASEIAALP